MQSKNLLNESKKEEETTSLFEGVQTLFKPPRITPKAEQLLNAVMYGNPKDVRKLVGLTSVDNECIALEKVKGVEECGRTWEAVSALEFAVWAGDPELINVLFETVPKAEQSKALKQLQRVMKEGTEHGKHLAPYYSVIEAYDKYIAKFDDWNWDDRDVYWVTEIGKKQFMLPLVGLQQMCDKEPFSPVPSFKRVPERTLEVLLRFSNHSLVPLSSSGLGDCFALHKYLNSSARGDMRPAPLGPFGSVESVVLNIVQGDLAAFRHLCEVRTKELASIIEQLKEPSVNMTSQENYSPM